MEQAPEFVVRVKTWPAYFLVATTVVAVVLYAALVVVLVRSTHLSQGFSRPSSVIFGVVVLVAILVTVASMVWGTRLAFRQIRYPPRLSAEGIQLWLFPTSEYVLVPWSRVAAVRTAIKGLSRALFVYVHDPDGLAGGDSGKLRKIRRTMRRFRGAPFLYALTSSQEHLRQIDEAVWRFSGGRLRLQG